uniref:Uncharacterized protein n=1 Tax=Glossina pallidipes TaxID=7398 RepID=A0A1A9Z265_GLOPL
MKPTFRFAEFGEFKALVMDKFDLIAISETWLKPQISCRSVHIPGSNLIRNGKLLGHEVYVGCSLKDGCDWKTLPEIINESLRKLWEWSIDNSVLINPTKSKLCFLGMRIGSVPPQGFLLCIKFHLAHALLTPQGLYGLEVVAGTTAGNCLKFSRVVNSMVRYVYGLRGKEHVSEYIMQFLGCTFETLSLWRNPVYFYPS